MKKQLYLIPYSHLDTQWRWEYSTTIDKYLYNTIEENLILFEKYDRHRFNFTGAIRYQFMKEYFPEKFKEVKKLVQDDKWFLAGTCLDETDVLIPNMESMIRNILYGDKWQKKEFGKTSLDYMIPDCFGFPANMPTVLSHCGINGFSSNKLTWKSAVGVPFEIGILQGPDGSEIVSALNPCKYDSHMRLPIYFNPPRLKRLENLSRSNGIHKSFQYYGVGDIGGAPKEVSVKNALKSIDYYEKKSDIEVLQSSTSEFFDRVTEDEKAKMDRYQGDLLLINHSAGVLTSAAIMKRWNRKNEQLAYAAETAAVMANSLAGLKYPAEKIEKAWTRVIGSQMHDILPGTCTPTAYDYSENDEVVALNSWSSILDDSAKAIAPKIDGEGQFIIFNPLVEDRNDLVRIDISNIEIDEFSHLCDNNQNCYEIEKVNNIVYFRPNLKGLSYTKFYTKNTSKNSVDKIAKLVGDVIELENDLIKVVISKNGEINAIMNKKLNTNILKNPISYDFQHERPFKFPAWNMDWKDRKKAPKACITKSDKVELIDNNWLFACVKLTTTYENSTLIKFVTLFKDSKEVEFKEEIDWFTKGVSLKVAFDTDFDKPVATYNWESSRIERDMNNPKQFEVPSRMWMNFGNDKQGFSIIEDSKYGYDRPQDSKVRMTLLFTPKIYYFNFFWDQRFQDFGHHTIKYSLRLNEGDYTDVDKHARQFNLKSRTYYIDGSKTDSIDTYNYISLDNENIGVSAIKKSEYENGIIIRLYDRSGTDQKGTVNFKDNIQSVYVVNGKEEKLFKVDDLENSFNVNVCANGINAYLICTEDNTISNNYESVEFEHNINFIGENGFLPKSQVPLEIESGNISFHINKEQEYNASKFSNQIISNDKYNTLSLLLCANNDLEADIELDGENCSISVAAMNEKIGQWEKRQWKKEVKHQKNQKIDYVWKNGYSGVEPGYVKRDRLDLFTTHTIVDGKVSTYEFGYAFRVDIDINDVKKVKLLENNNVIVLSATLSNQNVKAIDVAVIDDEYDY